MKHLRKFNSVTAMNTALARVTINILGLAYNNGTPVMKKQRGGTPVPPTPPTNLVISCSNNTVTITATNATTLEYNFDGSSTYTTYTQPFTISQTVMVYAKATNSDGSITSSQTCVYIDYSEPFYIEVTEGNVPLAPTSGLQMSTDKTNWTDTTESTLSTGKTYFRVATDQSTPLKPNWGSTPGSGSGSGSDDDPDYEYNIGGNINSLVKVNFANDTTCYAFYDNVNNNGFFENKSKLKSAGNLILPATTLAQQCYDEMFAGCSSLTTAPALPATTLTNRCYYYMFTGCTSLTTAPELPATTLAEYCYCGMFNGCSALGTAPALPATTLVNSCYASMFYGTSLTTAPALPATTLANDCYNNMFRDCTSLTTAPALPATTLAGTCYSNMFNGCTSLTTAPALPATTLVSSCYAGMFGGCTALTTAPALPATTMATYCYSSMFKGCTTLTTAPVLPATTLTDRCYKEMFTGCTSLNYIKCLATDISASDCTYRWVFNVAASGTFVKDPNMVSWTTDSTDGIPSGWTVQDAVN